MVFKALEKDRERRYQSADELRRDIEHYLKGELITARPPSVAYQLRIFARKNKALAGGAAVALVALTVGAIGASIGLVKARAAQEEAEQVTAFLEDMIAFANPYETGRPNLTMREALDRATETIGEEFRDKPLIEARLRHTIGETYQGLGVYTDAELHLRTAFEIRSRVLGDEHPRALDSMHALGVALTRARKAARAEPLLRQTMEMRRRILGDEHHDTLSSMRELGLALVNQGKHAEAEKIQRSTLDTSRRVLGKEDRGTLLSMFNLGYVLWNQGKYTEAGTLIHEGLQIQRRILGEEHSDTLWSMTNLALLLGRQGKYVEAEKLHRQTLEVRRRVLGNEHYDTLGSMNNLGAILWKQGKYAEAETVHRQTLEIERRVLGDEHPHTLASLVGLVDVLRAQGKLDEARPYVTLLIAHRKRVAQAPGADSLVLNNYAWLLLTCEPGDLRDPQTALPIAQRAVEISDAQSPNILDTLALAQKMTGDLDRAIETQGEAIALLLPGDRQRRAEFGTSLAELLTEAGRFAEAEPLLLDSYGQSEANPQRLPLQAREVRLREALERIVKLYESWGKLDKAAEYRAKIEAVQAAPETDDTTTQEPRH